MEAVLIKGMCTNIPLDGKRVDKKNPDYYDKTRIKMGEILVMVLMTQGRK